MSFLSKRKPESVKGDHGKVLIIGGCKDNPGSAYLAGIAALRAGADIVTIACPEKVAWTINSMSPELLTKKFEGEFLNWDNVRELIRITEDYDVVLLGSGLGEEPSTIDMIKEIVERCPVQMIIDSDAIPALHKASIDNAIVTPNEKEFMALTGTLLPKELEKKAEIVQVYTKNRLVVLLKGHVDMIISKDNVKYNKTGNPGMTCAGTGDVLAGIAAGFLAQTKDLFNSAYHAAHLNGAIGDHLLKEKGYGFTASDMLENICRIKKKLNI